MTPVIKFLQYIKESKVSLDDDYINDCLLNIKDLGIEVKVIKEIYRYKQSYDVPGGIDSHQKEIYYNISLYLSGIKKFSFSDGEYSNEQTMWDLFKELYEFKSQMGENDCYIGGNIHKLNIAIFTGIKEDDKLLLLYNSMRDRWSEGKSDFHNSMVIKFENNGILVKISNDFTNLKFKRFMRECIGHGYGINIDDYTFYIDHYDKHTEEGGAEVIITLK
jgi:hypothetical protein